MYPTDEELKVITEWHYSDLEGLMNYVQKHWAYANLRYWTQEENTYYLSTAGWSGNEDIINALRENLMFWSMCWQSSKRGGHYVFKLPKGNKQEFIE